jgi:hypothetical protein
VDGLQLGFRAASYIEGGTSATLRPAALLHVSGAGALTPEQIVRDGVLDPFEFVPAEVTFHAHQK